MTTQQVAIPAASPAVATGVRNRVLFMLCGLSMITYIDRVCFGTAAPQIAQELSLKGIEELKWAFTAFSIAYAVFEIPAGWLGDRLGPRGMLIRIVIWWSVCTSLTGLVGLKWGTWTFGGLGTLILLRFLFGAGEAGAYPNITRAIHNWFPKAQWEMAQGMIWMSGRLAGGLTPLLWALLVSGTAWTSSLMSWRGAFIFFGVIGVLWCLLFAVKFRNQPSQHPQVNAAERELIGSTWEPHSFAVPWGRLLTSKSLWALCIMYALINYGWAFHITYLPSYLQQRYQVPPQDLLGAVYKGAPLWMGAIGCLTGGFLVSFFSRRSGQRSQGRKTVGLLALMLCTACWLGASVAPNVHIFCLLASLSGFFTDLTLGACWATCQDLGKAHSGVIAACMNTIGTAGAALAVWMTGTIVQQTVLYRATLEQVSVDQLSPALQQTAALGGYQLVFWTYAAVYFIAALCWLIIDPDSPLISKQ